jgi:hypothetical protein
VWRDLSTKFEFDEQESDLLLETCRTLDTIDALSAAIDSDGLMVAGSQGQSVLNPAIAERRQQQAAFARLLTMLNLGEAESGSSVAKLTSVKAKTAANARWSRSKAARGA